MGARTMLTLAALGMFSYGTYSIVWAFVDVIRGPQLEFWAEAGVCAFGLLLMLASAFVRVRLPGGLAFAIGAMLGLQALAVHNAVHLDGGVAPQVGRAILSLMLIALALSDGRARGADL